MQLQTELLVTAQLVLVTAQLVLMTKVGIMPLTVFLTYTMALTAVHA